MLRSSGVGWEGWEGDLIKFMKKDLEHGTYAGDGDVTSFLRYQNWHSVNFGLKSLRYHSDHFESVKVMGGTPDILHENFSDVPFYQASSELGVNHGKPIFYPHRCPEGEHQRPLQDETGAKKRLGYEDNTHSAMIFSQKVLRTWVDLHMESVHWKR